MFKNIDHVHKLAVFPALIVFLAVRVDVQPFNSATMFAALEYLT
jgi:hypothetical protein